MLVTHKSCLDGTGSALVFLWAGGRRDRILFKAPAELVLSPLEVPSDVTEVWYADCCPSSLSDPAAGRPFRVFDHHVSGMRSFGSDSRCTFDMGRSGTSLLARELGQLDDTIGSFEGSRCSRQELVSALEAYDLGRFSDMPGQRLADVAASYTQEELLDVMHGMGPHRTLHDSVLSSRADAIASLRRKFGDSVATSARYFMMDFPIPEHGDSVWVGITASPIDWKNEAAQRVLDSGLATLAVVVDLVSATVSLRSHDDGPDCSRIAGLYGGGGHARAAGFSISGGRAFDALANTVFE